MKFLLRTTSVLAFAATALAASAQTVTFENLVGTGTQSTISSVGNTVASGGYTFTTTGANGLGFYPNGNFGSYPGNYTGSVALFNLTANTTVGMIKTGGGAFGIASLQVANVLAENDSRTFTFVGTHPDGTTVTQSTTFTLSAPSRRSR